MLKKLKIKSFIINTVILFALLYSFFNYTSYGKNLFYRMGGETLTIALYSSIVLAVFIGVISIFNKGDDNESSTK